ncbi:MAG: hypothetical protein Q3M24_20275 [Candidatus Electrothrix aestuarii]|uniref:Uncharacterized protein n=1 Tax=Candidatus Electrothrix aestuarii TaxID=3062594 RepID=A0AAU8LTV9_9BACT|nr:hypothetical protein [Candidatus Electrothrix aestuarii]
MSSFWPEGLSVSDTQSPYEILESAKEEWETASDGVLTLVLQESEPKDGIETITVHAKHIPSNRTSTLFSVAHRQKEFYPITIQPREKEELPDILKKSYYQPGAGIGGVVLATIREGKTVTNKWVSDTPSEFRQKLAEAFNLSVVKSAVLNLTSFKGASVDD